MKWKIIASSAVQSQKTATEWKWLLFCFKFQLPFCRIICHCLFYTLQSIPVTQQMPIVDVVGKLNSIQYHSQIVQLASIQLSIHYLNQLSRAMNGGIRHEVWCVFYFCLFLFNADSLSYLTFLFIFICHLTYFPSGFVVRLSMFSCAFVFSYDWNPFAFYRSIENWIDWCFRQF